MTARSVTATVMALMTPEQLDSILAIQLAVAWAGESGDDEPRLRWWDTDMVSKYGGLALLEQLTPRTAAWAALQTALEAARRVDAKARERDASSDDLVSLFHFGLPLDELLLDRLRELKRQGIAPTEVLPTLGELLERWDQKRFEAWLAGDEAPNVVDEPVGRRLTGKSPQDAVVAARCLAHALLPLGEDYPFAHYRDG